LYPRKKNEKQNDRKRAAFQFENIANNIEDTSAGSKNKDAQRFQRIKSNVEHVRKK